MPELAKPLRVRSHGSLRYFRTPGGQHVIVLPTCEVAPEHLIEDNWDVTERKIDHGNFRQVREIRTLVTGERIKSADGREVSLYVKRPEYRFEGRKDRLLQDIWWGGSRSGDKGVRVLHKSVEKQADWEARILLRLLREGIRAEVPQAILIDSEGHKQVVVKGVKTGEYQKHSGPTYDEIKAAVSRTELKPTDMASHNILSDREGAIHLIDVNRWEYPQFTDKYRKRLLEAIQKEIEHSSTK